ncbi:MAG: hypothetical protein PHY45_02425 [Rhodocyclaceae bacterium]|nr:hypothetical protein [Rhodocyclaceae bacterium]
MSNWYRTGTVTVVNGSPNVVGVGTLWNTQASVGDLFVGPDLAFYEVSAITDDTHLAVRELGGTDAYAGANASAQDYAIVRNFTSTLPAQLASQLAALMTSYHVTLDEMTAWLSGTGTVTVHDAVGNAYSVQTPAGMQAVLTGALAKSVAGGSDVVLTTSEASNLFHSYNGTRTADGNVVVPASPRQYFVFNNTTGTNPATGAPYVLTVKTPAGDGIPVPQGLRMVLQCDGTNVVNVITAEAVVTSDMTTLLVAAQVVRDAAIAASNVAATNAAAAAAAWTAALAADNSLNPAVRMNPSTIASDVTIPSGYSAYSGGPLTIGTGVNVTLNDSSEWSII